MRRAARSDASQAAIVDALRRIGVWVQHLHVVGNGCPDLLIWHRGRYALLECKQPGEKPNKLQEEYMRRCPGEIIVARTPEEAVALAVGKEYMK